MAPHVESAKRSGGVHVSIPDPPLRPRRRIRSSPLGWREELGRRRLGRLGARGLERRVH